MIATTDQKARLLDLVTGMLEMTRDGNRDIEEILSVLQVVKDDPDFAKLLLANNGEVLSPAVPADDEYFELEVNNDIDPMEVVRSAGYDPRSWEYVGTKLCGKQKYRTKLIRLGYVRNLEEAREKADKLGYRLLEGQAREFFKKKFPKPDGMGPIVFGGSGWRHPRGGVDVTFLRGFLVGWDSDFIWPGHDFGENWRWAVVSK